MQAFNSRFNEYNIYQLNALTQLMRQKWMSTYMRGSLFIASQNVMNVQKINVKGLHENEVIAQQIFCFPFSTSRKPRLKDTINDTVESHFGHAGK